TEVIQHKMCEGLRFPYVSPERFPRMVGIEGQAIGGAAASRLRRPYRARFGTACRLRTVAGPAVACEAIMAGERGAALADRVHMVDRVRAGEPAPLSASSARGFQRKVRRPEPRPGRRMVGQAHPPSP